jgi:hypothetical protein
LQKLGAFHLTWPVIPGCGAQRERRQLLDLRLARVVERQRGKR